MKERINFYAFAFKSLKRGIFILLSVLLVLGLNTVKAQSCQEIYVSPSGFGPGTSSSPASLTLALATANPGDVIKLAIGTYNINATLPLISDVTLEGGFIPAAGWRKTSLAGATTINRTTASPDGAANAQRLIALNAIGLSGFRLQDLTITTANANQPGMSTYGIYLSNCSNYSIVRCQIFPGNPANGLDGTDGSVGGNGSNGGNGVNGVDNSDLAPVRGGAGGSGCGGTSGASQCVNTPQSIGCNGFTGSTATLFSSGGGGGNGGGGGHEDRNGGRGGFGGGVLAGGGFTAIGLNTTQGTRLRLSSIRKLVRGIESGCNGSNNSNSNESECAVGNGSNRSTRLWALGPLGTHVGGYFLPGGRGATGSTGQGGQGGSGGGGGAGEGGFTCTDGTGAGGGGGGGGGCRRH
ncbi:MAG: hypothetical protein R2728_14020 [Chitinophagales bacterium]